MKQGFAKIVTASDGYDVLFYLGSSDNLTPRLHCVTHTEYGLQAHMGVEFGADEDAKAQQTLAKCDVVAANVVRVSFHEFMNQRFAPVGAAGPNDEV